MSQPFIKRGVPLKNLEQYVTGTGQVMWVHRQNEGCGFAGVPGYHCVIHAPSNHTMRGFPTHWRQDIELMERICPHGVGHPDPDAIAYTRRVFGEQAAAMLRVHGCCGCCSKGARVHGDQPLRR